MTETKYEFKFKRDKRTYFATVYATSETEAIRSLKEVAGNCETLKIKRGKAWAEPKSEFYYTRHLIGLVVLVWAFVLVLSHG